MNDLDVLKKFVASAQTLAKEASALAEMAKKSDEALKKSASDLKQATADLEKTASDLKAAQEAAPAPLSEERLKKAASAVVKLYGDRATVTEESLQKYWGADHNTLVDSILKVASDAISKKVQEPGMVAVKKPAVEKSASANASAVSQDLAAHRKAFDDIFGIR